jgi:ankyrin repeat protein
LDYATQKRQLNLIRALVAHGAFVDETDFCGWTSLHKAAFLGYRDVMLVLLELGADINLREADGRTVLHRAARKQDEKAVRLLLEMGADPTVQDHSGLTAADVAAIELRWFQQREGVHGRHQGMLASQRIVRMLGGIRG